MNPIRRTLVAALALSPAMLRAQPAGNQGYSTLTEPLAVENPAKVEIAEFFWYGCIHCYNFESLIEPWAAKLPPDAYFRRIPAVFNERWARDAAIYYGLEAMGVLGKVHRPLFDAIHKNRLRTDSSSDAFALWLKNLGVDPAKLEETMKSFGVQTKVRRAAQMSIASKIDGTPALMVHGRYTISAEQGRSQEGMLVNAERLIPTARKMLAAK